MNEIPGPTAPLRTIRSYVLREGRMTPAQERALHDLWPRFGVAAGRDPLDLDSLFGRHAPRVLEIGFGRGDVLLGLARAEPDVDFLGVEVHRPGIGHLLNRVAAEGLTNVRVSRADAAEWLADAVADASFQRILVLFPDPWPKKRHHKRRLLTPAFLELLARKLIAGGLLRIATDSPSYAEQILAALVGIPALRPCAPVNWRPLATRYEERARRHGNPVSEFCYERA